MSPTRPILRYHGGKWKLAPWILEHLPPHRVYVEPYGGAASVLLRKPRSYSEVYNDLDGEIVSLFRVVRDQGAELIRRLELTPFARAEFAESYEPTTDPIEQARRTITRSFLGFGSAAASGSKTGFRAASNKSGTTPARDWINFPGTIDSIIGRLRGVVIENKAAELVMRQHDGQDTLHYCDPPYVLDTRSMKNPYCKKGYRYEMTDKQHWEFASEVRQLRGMVVVSGYACALYEELFPDWKQVQCKALADGARDRVETLWLNPACDRSQQQMQLPTEAA